LRKPHSAASDVAQFVSVQQSTKSMLMDAGEQLIGRHGSDGVVAAAVIHNPVAGPFSEDLRPLSKVREFHNNGCLL